MARPSGLLGSVSAALACSQLPIFSSTAFELGSRSCFRAENAVRPIALGRKNYLFVGSEHGGRRAAILYSLIRTCERHRINAWEYLRDVLVRISTHPASQIDALLPHVWQARDSAT